MGDLKYIFGPLLELMKHEFTVYGFTLSFWQIFLFSIIIGFVGSALYKLFGGD